MSSQDSPALSSLSRLDSTSAQSVMARVSEGGLMDRGAVAVISIAAIRERAAERWPRKREDAWAYVNRKCAEHLSYADIHHRLNETDFVLAMTSEQGAAVQAVALRILEEVLVHFLGAAETPDLRIQMVTAFSGDEVSCAPLDPKAISRRPVYLDAPGSPTRPAVDPIEEKKRNPISFVARSGAAMQINFAVEHLVSIKHNVTAALCIVATVVDTRSRTVIPTRTFGKLPDDDLYFIDKATIDYAGLYMPKTKGQPPVMIPTSFRTLQTRKGRNALMLATGGATDLLRSGVLLELVDVDIGTPASQLTDVMGLVSALCRGIFIRVRPGKDMIAPVKGFRMQGLTLDCVDLPPADTQVALQMLHFGEQARHLAPVLAVLGLSNDGFTHVASVAGITHAGMRAASATSDESKAEIVGEALEILRRPRVQA